MSRTPITVGAFKVEPGCDPMCAGNFLNVTMPDGRILVIYADAVEPEEQGGASVLEVWVNQAALDAGAYTDTKQWGF